MLNHDRLRGDTGATVSASRESERSCTRASRPRSKPLTSNDKSPTSESTTPTLRWSGTSEVAFEEGDRASKPFWTERLGVSACALWSPTETVSPVSASSGSSGSSRVQGANSWFSVRSLQAPRLSSSKTCSPLSRLSPPESMDSGPTLERCKLISFHPTKNQARLLRKQMDASRWHYNRAVEYLRQPSTRASLKEVWAAMKEDEEGKRRREVCGYDAAYQAVKDAVLAMQVLKKNSARDGQRRELHFRSRRSDQNLFLLRLRPRMPKHAEPLPLREAVPEAAWGRTARVLYQSGQWFLSVLDPARVGRHEDKRVIALDPGVRKFVVGFDEDGLITRVGEQDFQRLARLCVCLDGLVSKRVRAPRRKKPSLRRAERRLRSRIKNLVGDMHRKVACWLTGNYSHIVLPPFETSQMVQRLRRRIRSKTVRAMLSWSHYAFARRLVAKAEERGVVVIRCSEAYTSKTNPWTGEVETIGAREMIHGVDRDDRGALNIMLRALGSAPATAEPSCA